jgi:hypothetical protein
MTKQTAFTFLLAMFLALLIFGLVYTSMHYESINKELVKQNATHYQACNDRFLKPPEGE